MQYNEDDRAQRYLDLFDCLPGQVNISVIPKGTLVAWHKHLKQTDYWFCLTGALKVGIVNPLGQARFEYLSSRQPRVLEIPPNHYHGYMALHDQTTLVYYVTHKYDPSDEIRATIAELGVDWSIPVK